MKKTQFFLITALSLACGIAFASNAIVPQKKPAAFYTGIQLGYGNTHYTTTKTINALSGYPIGSVDSSGLAGRFYVGYDFNKYFAIEGGMTLLPRVKFHDVIAPAGVSDINFRQSAFDLLAKATLPLPNNFGIYGKAGIASVFRNGFEGSRDGQVTDLSGNYNNTVPVVGVGANYGFNDHVLADVSLMHYCGTGDLQPTDFIGVGVVYRF